MLDFSACYCGMRKKPNKQDRILRRPEVERLTGLRKSTIYHLMSEGLFPRPIRLGRRAVGWRKSELTEWKISCPRGGSFAPGDNA